MPPVSIETPLKTAQTEACGIEMMSLGIKTLPVSIERLALDIKTRECVQKHRQGVRNEVLRQKFWRNVLPQGAPRVFPAGHRAESR